MTILNMVDSSKDVVDLGKALQELQKQQAQTQNAIALLAARLDNKHLYLKPGPQATPEEKYQQTLSANIYLMRTAIASNSWEMIQSLSADWEQGYKKEIADMLTVQEKTIIKQLKTLHDKYLQPAIAALDDAREAYNKALGEANLGYELPEEKVRTDNAKDNQSKELKVTSQMGNILPLSESKFTPQITKNEIKPTYTGWGTPKTAIATIAVDNLSADTEEGETEEESNARNSIFPS
jgi:hypothetical protein